MKFGLGRTLAFKILAVFVPLVFAAELAVFGLQAWDYHTGQKAELLEQLDTLVNVQRSALASAVWEFDITEAQLLIEQTLDLDFVQSVVVYDDRGLLLVSAGPIDQLPAVPEFRKAAAITFEEHADVQYVGRLEITVTGDQINQALLGYARHNALLLITLLIVLVFASSIATRLFIGRPLRLLKQAIEAAQHDQVLRTVEWSSNDEMGVVVRAYNEMRAAQYRVEEELQHAYAELEQRVIERTRELAEKERLLRVSVENMPGAFIVVDRDHRVVLANEAYARFYGHPHERIATGAAIETILRSEADRGLLLGEGDAAAILEARLSSYRSGVTHTFEDRLQDGRNIQVTHTPGPDGLVISVSIDITDRKAMETDLLTAKEAAEAASRAKASFLATMSHEIRTPMNGVIGMIDLLCQTPLDPDQRQMASTIRDSAFALLTIINDILDFSKIEAGRMDLESIPISISDVVDGVAETMGPNAARKGLAFISYCDPRIPAQIRGDQVRLRQILFNILGNAIKFTETGRVTLRADLADRLGDDRVRVCYSVRDQGVGMTETQIGRLFQPFQQAEASTTRRFGGTGLGLTIVRRLVDLMEGAIRVESTPGVGSCFVIDIVHPVAEGQMATPRDLDGVRVLGLEPDDALRRRIVREYLEEAGACVDLVAAPDAVAPMARAAAADDRPYDIVLIGYDYPDREKEALREAFRQDRALTPMRFVVGRPTAGLGAELALPDTTVMPATPMIKRNLVNAVAIAVGRASPNIRFGGEAEHKPHRQVPSVETAIENDELVLVVEDNKTNQDVIRRQLNALGYQCEIAEDGAQGLRAASSGRYAIVLSDVHMPNMDGFDMTRRLRERETRTDRRLPVIAITANALQGEADRCLAAGMDDYLAKPLEMKRLRDMLNRWMPHVAPRQASADAPPVAEETAPKEDAATALEPPASDDLAVDTTVLTGMFGDDPDMLAEVLDEFLGPAWDILNDIARAYDAHSAADLAASGHKLKSSARAVGARPLADLAVILERAGKAGDWPTMEATVPLMAPEMDRVVVQVQRIKARTAA